jgi:hypothetical protein
MNGAPYALLRGASWLSLDGDVVPVPSFHEKWIAEHPVESEGARNACELILKKRWISVVLFDKGYLELILPAIGAEDVRRTLFEFLSRNAPSWAKATIMSLDRPGYSLLVPADAASEESLAAALDKTI